jgi:hypothetical protein
MKSYRISRYCTLLLLLLWQGTAIFKKRKQQPQDLLEDTQVQHITPVAGDSHLKEEKTATTGTLRGYPGTAHYSCGRGQPSSRRENSNHRDS